MSHVPYKKRIRIYKAPEFDLIQIVFFQKDKEPKVQLIPIHRDKSQTSPIEKWVRAWTGMYAGDFAIFKETVYKIPEMRLARRKEMIKVLVAVCPLEEINACLCGIEALQTNDGDTV